VKKILYNTIGGLSLSLGIVGAFLPLLPTTCFILLATWAFAKSSPSLHNWLYYKSPFAQSIQDWQQYRVIPMKVKSIAASSIIASYLLTALLIENIYVLSGLAIGMLVLLTYLFSKPSETNFTRTAELHPPII